MFECCRVLVVLVVLVALWCWWLCEIFEGFGCGMPVQPAAAGPPAAAKSPAGGAGAVPEELLLHALS